MHCLHDRHWEDKMHRKLEQPHQLAFLDWVLIIVGISSKIIKTEKGIIISNSFGLLHQSCYIIHCTINQGKEKTNRNLQWTRIWKYACKIRESFTHVKISRFGAQEWHQEVMYNQPKGWHVECINIWASENISYTNARVCEVHEHVSIEDNLA